MLASQSVSSQVDGVGGALTSSPWKNHKLVLLVFCLFLLFQNLGGPALFEPDEGRNAEVAREILVTGDWVTPHYNFLPRLDKPIFYYWFVALSFKLFGVSEWSARLPSAVAGLAGVLIVYALARSFLGTSGAMWSSLVLATSIEYFILSRTVILDMTFALFVTVSLCAFYWGSRSKKKATKQLFYLLMFAATGCATLAKGPVGFALPALVIFFYLLLVRKWYLLREMELFWGSLIFVAIVAPWYVLAELRNPGYLRYFLVEEYVVRFFTPRFNRTEPWHLFFGVLAVGMIPWTGLLPLVVKNLWDERRNEAVIFLFCWVALPFALFSVSSSKLPHYILPIYAPLSILVGDSLRRVFRSPLQGRGWVLFIPWFTLVLIFLLLVVTLLWPELLPDRLQRSLPRASGIISESVAIPLLAVCVAGAVVMRLGRQLSEKFLYVSCCVGFGGFFFLFMLIASGVSLKRSSKEIAQKSTNLEALDDGALRLVIYDAYLSSLPFYLRTTRPIWIVWSGEKKRIMGSNYVADKRPAPSEKYGRVLLTYDEFFGLWRESPQSFLVFLHDKDLDRFSARSFFPPREMLNVGGLALVTNQ